MYFFIAIAVHSPRVIIFLSISFYIYNAYIPCLMFHHGCAICESAFALLLGDGKGGPKTYMELIIQSKYSIKSI